MDRCVAYPPISAILFFVGTALFAFYSVPPELLPDSGCSEWVGWISNPLANLRNPLDPLLTIVIGPLTILLVGWMLSSRPTPQTTDEGEDEPK